MTKETNATKTTPQRPVRPEPLDTTKLHTPAAVRAYKAAESRYWQEMQDIARKEEQEAVADRAYANRILNEDEAYALAVERQNRQRELDLQRQVAALAAKTARDEYLASTTPTVEVCETSFYAFLVTFEHFAAKGYTLDINGPQTIVPPNFFHVAMVRKPTKAKAAA